MHKSIMHTEVIGGEVLITIAIVVPARGSMRNLPHQGEKVCPKKLIRIHDLHGVSVALGYLRGWLNCEP